MGAATVRAELHAEIFALAMNLCSCTEESAALRRLCEAAAKMLASQLRKGVTVEQCESAFVCAAAWLASAAYESGQGGEDISSLRAGQITVTAASAGHHADRCELLRRSAKALMAPYCREEKFAFHGVQG